MRPTPRHAVAALSLLALTLPGWPPSPPPAPLDGPCLDWIEVRRAGRITLECGIAPIAPTLDRCGFSGEIRRGDRVHLGPECAVSVAPMPASRRLAQGLRLDVNRASITDLTAISGIGPAMARRIVAKRPYARLEDLERVRGIGPTRRRRFTSRLRLGPPARLWPSSRPHDASTLRKP